MPDFLTIIAGTVTMRPYVFAFFAVYLLAAISHLGWRKVALFTICGYLIAFVSEFCSINSGFPYGWYYYLDSTSSKELWIAGVPFFDSISYVFLAYCSYSMALFIISPLKKVKHHLIILETREIRRSGAALFLGALLQTYLDIIIDPVALQGERWFLGKIYGYSQVGAHFGVPLSNYLGWLLVSGLMIMVLQLIDRFAPLNRKKHAPVTAIPYMQLLGPILYLSVIIFNLAVATVIGEQQIAVSGLFTVLLPLVMVLILAKRRINQYKRDELSHHLRDFPLSPAGE